MGICDAIKIGVIILDKDLKIVDINREVLEKSTLDKSKLIGKEFTSFFPKKEADSLKKLLGDVWNEKIDWGKTEMDIRLGKTKKLHRFDLRIKKYENKLVITVIDRSWLYETLEKMNIIQSAVEHMAEGLVVTDVDGNIIYVNPGFTKITGYAYEEVIGKNPRILKSGKHDKEFYKNMWNTILQGKVWHGELINKRKDGSFYWEEMTIVPIKDRQGKIVNFVAVKHDVTDRKKLEEELKKREEFYRSIFDSSLDGIFIETLDGKLIDVNEAGAKMFGYTRKELLDKGLKAIIPEESLEKLPYIIEKLKKSGRAIVETFNKHKDGYLIPIELSANLIKLDGKEIVLVIARDLRYREEEEIKYRILGEMASDAVILANEKGEIEYWNPSAEKIFGFTEEEVYKKPFWNFIFPEELLHIKNEIIGKIQKINPPFTKRFESVAKRKDEFRIPVEIGVSVFTVNNKKYALAVVRDISERKKLEEELKRRIDELEVIQRFSLKISSHLDLKELINSVYNEIKGLIPFDSFALGLKEKNTNKIKFEILTSGEKNLGPLEIEVHPKRSLSGWVITSKKPLLIRDLNKEKDNLPAKWIKVGKLPKSWLGVPLIYKNDVLGIIILQSYTPNMYDDRDKNFLITLGTQLSIAISNALLYSEIKTTKDKLETLINNQMVGITTVDLKGNITFTNQKFAEMLGYSIEEVLKKNIFELTTPEGRDLFKKKLKRRERGYVDYYENVMLKKDGTPINVLISASPLKNEKGEIIGSIEILLDITERKKWEKEIQKMNDTLSTLYNISLSMGEMPDIKDLSKQVYKELKRIFDFHWFFIAIYDKEEKQIRFELLISPKGERGNYVIKFDPQNSLTAWVIKNQKPLFIRDVKKDELPTNYMQIEGEGGLERSVIIVPLIYQDKAIGALSIQHRLPNMYDENVLKYLTIVANWLSVMINNIKLYNEVKETKDWLESLLKNAIVGIATTDINDNITFSNERFAKMLGYSVEEIIGRNLKDFTTPEGYEKLKAGTKRRKRGEKDYYETQFIRKDGKIIDVLIYASPLYDNHGNVVGSTGIIVDITERKAMEKRLKEEKERYKRLFEAMANIVVIIKNEKIVYVNKVFERTTGYKLQEVLGQPFTQFIHPDTRELTLKNYRRRMKGLPTPDHYIIKIIGKNGKDIWMDIRATIIDWEEGRADLVSMVDITELKEMEDRLLALDEIARKLKLAKTKEEMYETTLEGIFHILNLYNAAILEVVDDELVMVKSKGYSNPNFKIKINSKKGITPWVARNNLPYYSPDTREDSLYIEGVKGARCEYATPISIEDKIFGVLDVERKEPYSISEDDIKIIDLLANNLAVALKSWENQKEIEKAKNLQELMLHIVSHDLKNPLAVLSGYLDLLRVEYNETYVDAMERAINEASNIIEKARLFSRLGAGKIEEERVLLNLKKEIEDVVELIAQKYPQGKIQLEMDDIEIYAYPLIREVFINLLDNAFKYGASEVKITADVNDFVEIRVIDNGPGIPLGKRGAIFQAFETLSPKKGSGLGLTIVKMIIDLHNGKIWVENNKPHGSIFVIQLPKD